MWVYDLEVYKNEWFGLFRELNTNNYKAFAIDDFDKLLKFIESGINLISWNGSNYDDIILRYIKENHKKVMTNSIFAKQTTSSKISCLDLYNLSQDIIVNKGQASYIKDLKWKKHQHIKSIDIKAIMDPMPSLKKTEVRMRFAKVQDLPYAFDAILKPDEILELRKYCQVDVDATHEFYKQTDGNVKLRTYLEQKYNVTGLQTRSGPQVAGEILTSTYCQQTNTNKYELQQKTKETYSKFQKTGVSNFVPNWITFKTPELQQLLEEVKTLNLPMKESGHVDGSQLKRIVKIGDEEYQMGVGGLHIVQKAGYYD